MIQQVELEHSVRKISSSFFVLCLLFGEKSSEGDNIVIDLFWGHRGCGTVRHVQGRFNEQCFIRGKEYSSDSSKYCTRK